MQSANYNKISITAKLVAYARQFSDIAFADDVATYVKAEEAVRQIASNVKDIDADERQDIMSANMKIYAPLLETRYKSIAELIRQTGIKQVLELASGFSLRGLAMCADADIVYVESDLAEVNEEKQPLIASLKEKYDLDDRPNHHVVTANALDKAELEAATAFLDHDEPLLVVNEGLIPYLDTTERDTLTDTVRYLLNKFAGGAWITPDFATKETSDVGGMSDYRKRFREAVNSMTGRSLHQSAFDSEDAITEFLEAHGFTGKCTNQTNLVRTLVSPERLNINQAVMDALKPRMKIWLLH